MPALRSYRGCVVPVYRAYAARTGAQLYEHGTEYRDASEVFAPESLASWQGAPVTVGHKNVDMASVRTLAVGYVRSAYEDGDYVGVELVIFDAETAQKIDAQDLVELSAGYSCAMAGNRQIDIRINHLALGPRDWARCGPSCAIIAKA